MTANLTKFDQLYEFTFPLSQWSRGTDHLQDTVSNIDDYRLTLSQLLNFKRNYLLFHKPTLSTSSTIVFWVHKSIFKEVIKLTGVRGGFPVSKSSNVTFFQSNYKIPKNKTPKRRILLDLGCDSPKTLKSMKDQGFEVVCLWDYIADLYHYEIIELCNEYHFDVLVTLNERLFTPTEAWLDYLFPKRTQIFIPHFNTEFTNKNYIQYKKGRLSYE